MLGASADPGSQKAGMMTFYIVDYKKPNGKSAWVTYTALEPLIPLARKVRDQFVVRGIRRAIEGEGSKVAFIREVIGAQNVEEAEAYASDPRFRVESGFTDRCIYYDFELAKQYIAEVFHGDFT